MEIAFPAESESSSYRKPSSSIGEKRSESFQQAVSIEKSVTNRALIEPIFNQRPNQFTNEFAWT